MTRALRAGAPVVLRNADIGSAGDSLWIEDGRIAPPSRNAFPIDLSGHAVLPGLINAHDHLQLNNVPRLPHDAPFASSYDWIDAMKAHRVTPGVQAAVADGRLTEGHGRALGGLAVELQDRVLDSVTGQELSVRQTEELVRRLREPKPEPTGPLTRRTDPELERVEEDLRRSLGTKVSLARSRRGGRIVIEYYSDEELGRLYERLTGGTA